MADIYKLPGSSYEELVKIIKAYSSSKNGVPVSLTELAQASGMDKTVISRNNGFLVQIKLVSEGNKKAATELCINLGRAYVLEMADQIAIAWNDIICNDDFLNRMISTIQIKGEMSKSEFINHIVFSSGNNNTNNARAGASAVIEILKLSQLIEEKEGMIVTGNGNTKPLGLQKTIFPEENLKVAEVVNKKNESTNRENASFETGYYIQSYTCETGKTAKFIIPEDATEDDLLAFSDMLDIVLKRKFKIKVNTREV